MAGGQIDDDEITGINVTPLVDVMLVLLIIFMVTATYIVNQSIEVQLPNAESGQDVQKSESLEFVLDQESKLYLDGQPVAFEELGERIDAERQKGAGESLTALIAADEKTPHGAVVKLIDTVRKHGITDFAINVEATASSSQPADGDG